MNFLIADTFTDSLAKLTGDEQKSVKITTFDLQMNPANPGMQFHKLDKAKDKRFWSVRVSSDLRIIVHRSEQSLLLCYVGHHDPAYKWAELRKLETHPKTGAAQLVEVRERVQEVLVSKYVEVEKPRPEEQLLFAHVAEEALLGYGVPPEWVEDVQAATENSLLELVEHLPGEAAEALIDLAVGGKPAIPQPAPPGADPFVHPDAQRRFRIMQDVDELALALEYPWEKWTIFLHPAQRQLVERDYSGPARVSGSAGTGKTIVALHRAVYLAKKHPEARVLLVTFSAPLANMLRIKLRRLLGDQPRLGERVEVYGMEKLGRRLYELQLGPLRLTTREQLRDALAQAAAKSGRGFTLHFLLSEWEQVVDAWQVETWEAYRDVKRLRRKTRLPEARRQELWAIFEEVRKYLQGEGMITEAAMYHKLAARLHGAEKMPFDFAVIDEAQDISVPQLRLLAALGAHAPNRLFFAGDLGQRIFQTPFSWKSLGVDIRGRSHTLKINYRTSHQIRRQADRLLGPEVADVDGVIEERRGIQSVFNGPDPEIIACDTPEDETEAVAVWLRDRLLEGYHPHEMGIFVRSSEEFIRAQNTVESAGIPYKVLDEDLETASNHASICTMHLAKGLEFRAVAVMACDDDVIPSQARIESVTDDADLQEVYETERQLLYVACTRARDRLLVTSGGRPSEFLEDLKE